MLGNFKKADSKSKKYLTSTKYQKFYQDLPPNRPLSHECYLYHAKSTSICDGYNWRQCDIKKNQNGVVKVRYYLRNIEDFSKNTKFSRCVYYLEKSSEQDRIYFLMYYGDDEVAVQQPMSKSTDKFILKKISSKSHDKPQKIYKELIEESSSLLPASSSSDRQFHESHQIVKNIKQVYNKQQYEKRKDFGKDAVHNICELSYNIEGFIHQFRVVPEQIIICGMLFFDEYTLLIIVNLSFIGNGTIWKKNY